VWTRYHAYQEMRVQYGQQGWGGGGRESADLSTQDKSYRFSRWLILTNVYKLGDL
jgi:hypothetical protein